MMAGLRQRQQVVVALEVAARAVMLVRVVCISTFVGEALAAVAALVELVALQHRAHRAVDHEDALRERVEQLLRALGVQPG